MIFTRMDASAVRKIKHENVVCVCVFLGVGVCVCVVSKRSGPLSLHSLLDRWQAKSSLLFPGWVIPACLSVCIGS